MPAEQSGHLRLHPVVIEKLIVVQSVNGVS